MGGSTCRPSAPSPPAVGPPTGWLPGSTCTPARSGDRARLGRVCVEQNAMAHEDVQENGEARACSHSSLVYFRVSTRGASLSAPARPLKNTATP